MSAFQPRLVTFALLLAFQSLVNSVTAIAGQDIPGGASLIFISHPKNPSVHQKSEHSSTPQNNNSLPTSGSTNGNNALQKTDSTGAVEDALALGNSARETKPPRYEDSEKAYKLAAKLNPKDPRPYIRGLI